MAQVALTVGGSIAGSYFGPVGAEIGGLAGSIVGGIIDNALFGGGGQSQRPQIGDTRVQVSTYGKPITQGAGTARVAGEVIWSTPIIATTHTQTVGGMKGFGDSQSAETVTYGVSFAVAFCKGPVHGIQRLWADKKLIMDRRASARHVKSHGETIRIYLGTEDQQPNGLIQQHAGVRYTPAFRGICYVVLESLQLADFANHIPQIEAEIVFSGSDDYPSITLGSVGAAAFDGISTDPDRGFVYVSGTGGLYKVDPVGPSTLAHNAAMEDYVAVGSTDGYLYGYSPDNGFAQFYMELAKFDPVGLQQVASWGSQGIGDDAALDNVPGELLWKSRNGYVIGADAGSIGKNCLALLAESTILADGTEIASGSIRWVGKIRDVQLDMADMDATGTDELTYPRTLTVWAVGLDATTSKPTLYKYSVVDNGLVGTLEGPLCNNPITQEATYDLSAAFSITSGKMGINYLPDQDALLIGFATSIIRWDIATETVTGAEITNVANLGGSGGVAPWRNRVLDGIFLSDVTLVDVVAWSTIETVNLSNWGDLGTSLSSSIYEPTLHGILRAGANLVELLLDRFGQNTVNLSDVITDLCEQGGLTSSEIDVSGISDHLRGYVIGRPGDVRSMLQPLSEAFFFDAFESDYKLTFKTRGGSSIVTIPRDQLGEVSNGAPGDPLVITDPQEEDLPVRLVVSYMDQGINYQNNLQDAKRRATTTPSQTVSPSEWPIVFTADEAKQVAEKKLMAAITEARTFKFATSRAWLQLNPADVVEIPNKAGTANYIMRLKRQDIGADGVVSWEAQQSDAGAYSSTAIGAIPDGANQGDAGGSTSNASTPIGASGAVLMDTPMLRDSDDDEGFYIGGYPLNPSADWNGEVLLRSNDAGATFETFQTIKNAVAFGSTANALSQPRAWTTWDRTNKLTVWMANGADQLVSTTELAVLNGANVALVGNEIIQFVNATENSDGSYTLDTLTRGRRGSDPFISHSTGERFVLLTNSTVYDKVEDGGDLNLTRFYKPTSIGESTYPEAIVPFVNTGNRQRPYAVCSIAGTRDGSNNLTITWIRRTRIGGENDWRDAITSVPLGEASENYQIDILDGSGNVKRTIAVTSQSASYSAADQTTDFGSAQANVHVAIYQINNVVGRGFKATATV